jgi:rubrerythrin
MVDDRLPGEDAPVADEYKCPSCGFERLDDSPGPCPECGDRMALASDGTDD